MKTIFHPTLIRLGWLVMACAVMQAAHQARADAVWTGAVDNDFWNSGNWSGTAPVAGVPYAGNVIINNALITTGEGTLVLADSYSLAITNSTVVVSAINGVAGGGANAVSIHGSTVTCASIAIGINASLTGHAPASVLNLTGANRIINCQTEICSVTLAPGSRLVSTGGNNDPAGSGTPTPPDRSNGLSIFHALTGRSYAVDALTPPLSDFHVSGADLTPFGPLGGGNGTNEGAFTIHAKIPPGAVVQPELLVGFRGTPDYPDQYGVGGIWIPTLRTLTDWQSGLDFAQLLGYANNWPNWSTMQEHFLADLNGDGIDDKIVYWENPANPGPAQILATYSGPPPSGFTTSNFNPPYGDVQTPWGWISAASSKLVFGDLDGDGIDDCVVTQDDGSGQLQWGAWKSEGVIGISTDHGATANFSGWSLFGNFAARDRPLMGDFNGDGIADRVIYGTNNLVQIDYSNPAGGWGDGIADVSLFLGIAGDKLAISDINGDGLDDLVIYGRPDPGNANLQLLFGYYNDGNNFASLNGVNPNIQDVWGIGDGVLFGQLSPPAAPVVPQSPALLSPAFQDGLPTAFRFSWNSVNGVSYKVDCATNLASPVWNEIATVLGTGGLVSFTNSPAPAGAAFYRVRAP